MTRVMDSKAYLITVRCIVVVDQHEGDPIDWSPSAVLEELTKNPNIGNVEIQTTLMTPVAKEHSS